ncbi:hypothetical protein [Lacisediminihabitans profunda]|uniref:DUF1508 domain-containing protein n=1 Tax=Lacisediminihabitans profunda TaxID=2594790 RepID=A0A5C8UT09_9MICO|nr:hypothetical protein [Lacisediminihabitans profunda]TXN31063.1 hypothetical protein FVP33_05560 [Lacisediminihabitans profunda]
MSGPRIIFTRFLSGESPRLAPWREHHRRVLSQTAVASQSTERGSVVVWRLVSSNNRELARSAEIFGQFHDAVASARSAASSAEITTVCLVSDERGGSYGWYLADADRPVAICARWYDAERERRHAVELAIKGLALATVGEGARELMDSGARRSGRNV